VTFDDAAVSLDAIVTAIEDQGYEVPGDDGPSRLPMA
jgi:copper chaperone CopZ